jgi:predicted alpha/beta-hydrolase family hydrolase
MQTHEAEVETPYGSARYLLTRPGRPRGLVVLGHGAGGDVDAKDLLAVAAAAVTAGFAVALVTQPYRVAGRRAPAPAAQLDVAWSVVVRELTAHRRYKSMFVGGRSSGARVACRTAAALRATGVVALAFPLHPPGRPDRSRDDELRTGLPTLVVNGDRDAFGVPEPDGSVEVVVRPDETHALNKAPEQIGRIISEWLLDRA